MTTVIAVIITAGIVAVITWLITSKMIDKSNKATIGSAREKAQSIIAEAERDAETIKKEAKVEAKETALQMKNDIEDELKANRKEISQYEKRVIAKEEAVDKRYNAIERQEKNLERKSLEIEKIKTDTSRIRVAQQAELERISQMSASEARGYVIERAKHDTCEDVASLIKEAEEQAKANINAMLKNVLVDAIERCDIDHVSDAMISVVELPGDDMKGRIIGREGRNIHAFEKLTGVELIIDDTPEAVVLSCFNPIRREVARKTLQKLIADGRIHPAKIEEMYNKAEAEVNEDIQRSGEDTVIDLGIRGVHPEIVKLVGRLKYRTSYGQNALKHSEEVAIISGLLAAELGENETLARRAGLLHDIGKAIDYEVQGTHVQIGAEISRKYKENPVVINAIESHHGDVPADNVISVIVKCADMISAARPGARREDMEVYINRLKNLEEIANSHEGVSESYAIQAGRELRVLVKPEKVSDSEMYTLAKDIADEIENDLSYPGQIRVSVIRESRVAEYAK